MQILLPFQGYRKPREQIKVSKLPKQNTTLFYSSSTSTVFHYLNNESYFRHVYLYLEKYISLYFREIVLYDQGTITYQDGKIFGIHHGVYRHQQRDYCHSTLMLLWMTHRDIWQYQACSSCCCCLIRNQIDSSVTGFFKQRIISY